MLLSLPGYNLVSGESFHHQSLRKVNIDIQNENFQKSRRLPLPLTLTLRRSFPASRRRRQRRQRTMAYDTSNGGRQIGSLAIGQVAMHGQVEHNAAQARHCSVIVRP
jgi:hypothetical protein